MKRVVYTAIFGDYDTLIDPTVITPGWEYLCFTDQPLSSDVWKIIHVDPEQDRVRQARRIKILPPFEYNECLWMDARFEIIGDVDQFTYNFNEDLVLPKHPSRSKLMLEAEEVIRLKKDDVDVVRQQVNEYYDNHFFKILCRRDMFSLPATGIIFRRWTDKINRFSKYWFNEVLTKSKRDQLSFNFSAFATGVPYQLIYDDIYCKTHPFFLLHKHK